MLLMTLGYGCCHRDSGASLLLAVASASCWVTCRNREASWLCVVLVGVAMLRGERAVVCAVMPLRGESVVSCQGGFQFLQRLCGRSLLCLRLLAIRIQPSSVNVLGYLRHSVRKCVLGESACNANVSVFAEQLDFDGLGFSLVELRHFGISFHQMCLGGFVIAQKRIVGVLRLPVRNSRLAPGF